MFSERPGYRIDSRTIKRGSRPSILIVSFVESTNLCILAINFIGSYLDLILVLVLVVLVMTRLSSPKTVVICVFYCGFDIGDFVGSSVRKIYLFIYLQNLHCLFSIFKGCICRPLSNKIGFTSFGLHWQKIFLFRFANEKVYLYPFGIILT